eukprot:scaffold164153_cov29-Tisochrysis_lutea.AAC.6
MRAMMAAADKREAAGALGAALTDVLVLADEDEATVVGVASGFGTLIAAPLRDGGLAASTLCCLVLPFEAVAPAPRGLPAKSSNESCTLVPGSVASTNWSESLSESALWRHEAWSTEDERAPLR